MGATDAREELIRAAALPLASRPFPPLPHPESARRAAVLVLFGRLDSIPSVADVPTVARDLDVLLQRRASTLSSHPGQISFPGGGWEPGDADAAATALREAKEETGLDPHGIDVLATFGEIPLAASDHLVTPVLGWWTTPSRVAAVDHAETVEVFRIPVATLLDPATRFTSSRRRGAQTFRGPAFDVNGTIVWGFTAMILDALFDTAAWTIPWNHHDVRPV